MPKYTKKQLEMKARECLHTFFSTYANSMTSEQLNYFVRKYPSRVNVSEIDVLRRLSSETLAYLVVQNPYIITHAAELLNDQQIEYCLNSYPSRCFDVEVFPRVGEKTITKCALAATRTALKHAHLLSAELFEKCVRRDSTHALFEASHLLSDELFDFCARKNPETALLFFAGHLSKDTLTYCIRIIPSSAGNALCCLTEEQLEIVLKRSASTILKSDFAKFLPRTFLDRAAKKCPSTALKHVASLLSPEVVIFCTERANQAAVKYAWDVLPIALKTRLLYENWDKLEQWKVPLSAFKASIEFANTVLGGVNG